MPHPRVRRALAYLWAAPTSAVGLPFVILARSTGGRAKLVDGVIECSGGAADFFLRRVTPLVMGGRGASAMTLGHVVIAPDQATLDLSRDHERVHVRQAERWGPLFLPAYFAASAWAKLRGRDAYYGNRFEREAYGTITPPPARSQAP